MEVSVMAENTVTSKDTPRQETIHPYFPNDLKIIKNVDGSGRVTYHHPATKRPTSKDEVFTWESDLYSQLDIIISRFKTTFDMIFDSEDGEVFDRFYFFFEAVMRDAVNQVDEMFEHVHRNIGITEIEMVGGNSRIYRNGMVVGTRLRPRKEATEPQEA
jgi:hypothetical protein